MASTPRAYLFHGSDSRASSLAVQRWRTLFVQKYGDGTFFTIDADELSLDAVRGRLREVLQLATLFPEPRFILVKRLASHDRGASRSFGEAAVKILEELVGGLDENYTVVFWEASLLPDAHPILAAFAGWQKAGLAKVACYLTPMASEVIGAASAYLKPFGQSLSREAQDWLRTQYDRLGRQARLLKRLKARDVLAEDERAWWLYSLLDVASLRAGETVEVVELLAAGALVPEPLSPFEVSQAVAAADWGQVRTLASRLLEEEGDDAAFSLISALRWQLERQPGHLRGETARYGLRLLAEAEIAAKSFPIRAGWLIDLVVLRLASGRPSGGLLDARRLWLADLARS